MSESLYERAVKTVREGLVQAADRWCLDLFEADQTVVCAREQVKERFLVGASYKLSLVLIAQAETSERIQDLRIRKNALYLGMRLEQERELNDAMAFAVANAIEEELDFLIEGWALRRPVEHYDALYRIATERQREVLTEGVASAVA